MSSLLSGIGNWLGIGGAFKPSGQAIPLAFRGQGSGKLVLGEGTRIQLTNNVSTDNGGIGGLDTLLFPGLGTVPLPYTFYTYRQIRGNPTVSLARIAANAPVKAAHMALEARDGADDVMVAYIRDNIEPLWPSILQHAVRARDFGFSPLEVVFELRDGSYFINHFKPLLVDATVAMQDEFGTLIGCLNYATPVPRDKLLWFKHDDEAGNPYGRSWYEGRLRTTIIPVWNDTIEKITAYIRKAAGVIPMIEYPEGTSRDSNDKEVNNFALAQGVLNNLTSGRGVFMPNVLAKYAEEAISRGIDITKLKAWTISFLEAKGQHGGDFDTLLGRLDKYIVRSMGVPERAALEGQFGTRAEASVHTDILFAQAEEFLSESVIPEVNVIINALLTSKYGPGAKDQVYISASATEDDSKEFIRQIVSQVMTNPQNIDLFLRCIKLDAALDAGGMPKTEDMLNNEDVIGDLEELRAARAPALAPGADVGAPAEDDAEDPPAKPAPKAASLVIKNLYRRLGASMKRTKRKLKA